jgi:hypothetical protein
LDVGREKIYTFWGSLGSKRESRKEGLKVSVGGERREEGKERKETKHMVRLLMPFSWAGSP